MANGSVVVRSSKRGDTYCLKYRDASGSQRWETLGTTAGGWSARKAEQELRVRLVAVEREGFKKPERVTFEKFVENWWRDYPDARSLKASTRRGFASVLKVHLLPAFGRELVGDITTERVERYIAEKRRRGLAPATINQHLGVLRLIFRSAVKQQLLPLNPVAYADRPRVLKNRWRKLTPVEIQAVEAAFDTMIREEPEGRTREDMVISRVLFLTYMGSSIRLSEALGLKWQAVHLADPAGPSLRVEETLVGGHVDTPKSVAGWRTLAIGNRLAGVLFDHRSWSPYKAETDRVFCNTAGGPFDARRYARHVRQALAIVGITEYMRPSHDMRGTSITNAAAAGTPAEALKARAGHASYQTTQLYIDHAGEAFREEAERLERRLWGTDTSPSPEAVVAKVVANDPLAA